MIMDVPRDLPAGTVTFLFTDVEGSTRLLHELGTDRYAHALAEHRRILRETFIAHGGAEVDTQGDAFFVAFRTAPEAVRAATQAIGGTVLGPDSGADRHPHWDAAPGRGRVCRRRCAPSGPDRRGRPRRASAGLRFDRRPVGERRAARPGRAPPEGSDPAAAALSTGDSRARDRVPAAEDA